MYRIGVVLPFAFLCGCATIQVETDYDPSVNFSGLKTYGWIAIPKDTTQAQSVGPFVDSRIRSAVETQLAARGYEKMSSGTPDFLVAYQTALEKKLDTETVRDYYSDGGYGYGPHGGGRYGTRPYGGGARRVRETERTVVHEYEQGSLLLDIFDARTKQIIWQGSAEAEVTSGASPQLRTKRINEAVSRMLENFPPDND
jgi:hypothetical protein